MAEMLTRERRIHANDILVLVRPQIETIQDFHTLNYDLRKVLSQE
jgi:hypothetical protein